MKITLKEISVKELTEGYKDNAEAQKRVLWVIAENLTSDRHISASSSMGKNKETL